MKKITKILSLTVVVAGIVTPIALLSTSSNNINVDQGINSVDANETIEVNDDNGIIETNEENDIDGGAYETVGDIINANDPKCFAEDSNQNANTWMGITSGFVKFAILDEGTAVGTVSVSGTEFNSIASTYLKFPNYITYKSKRYDVTSISTNAFSNCPGLTGTLTIPASVTSIDTSVFTGCSNLIALDLNSATSLKTIEASAFSKCSGLASNLTIPTSVTSIGQMAFYGCSGLTGALTIPAGVTSIGDNAFKNCSGLRSLDLTNATNLNTIDKNAFEGCYNLASTLTIPASVATIGSQAFSGCSGLKGNLTIPASVTTIGNSAFSGCSNLTGLDLISATGLKTIGDGTFASCTSLKETLIIPAGVTSIGENAFLKCTNLTSLDLSNATNLKSIGSKAFYDCSNLTNALTIPASVTSIGEGAFGIIGSKEVKFLSQTPPTTLGTNIFGTNNSTITISVLEGTKAKWIAATSTNILGIANFDQIIEFTPPAPQPSSSFPVWAYLVIIGGSTVLVGALTITIVTIKRKNAIDK